MAPLHHREAVAAVRVDGHRLQPIEAQREAVRVGLGSGRGSRGHDLARGRSTEVLTAAPQQCQRDSARNGQGPAIARHGRALNAAMRTAAAAGRRGARPRPASESYVDAPAHSNSILTCSGPPSTASRLARVRSPCRRNWSATREPPTARPDTVSWSRKSGSTDAHVEQRAWRLGTEAEQRLQEQEERGGRPRLRRAAHRVAHQPEAALAVHPANSSGSRWKSMPTPPRTAPRTTGSAARARPCSAMPSTRSALSCGQTEPLW